MPGKLITHPAGFVKVNGKPNFSQILNEIIQQSLGLYGNFANYVEIINKRQGTKMQALDIKAHKLAKVGSKEIVKSKVVTMELAKRKTTPFSLPPQPQVGQEQEQ